jgi:hypothetical protein
MKNLISSGESFTENRKELANEYFHIGDGTDGVLPNIYAQGNMGIVSLLSDLQEQIQLGFKDGRETKYWNRVLNNIKCVLITEDRQLEKVQSTLERN